MTDKPKRGRKIEEAEAIETEPGAEERFERTVRNMLRTPPRQHQEDVGKKAKPKPAKRKSG